jgi:Protein of unknown function (DUF4232)
VSKTGHLGLVRPTFLILSCVVVGSIALVGCGVLRTSNVTTSPSPIAVEPIVTPSAATGSGAPAPSSPAPTSTAVAACVEKDLQLTDPWGPPQSGMGGETVAIVFRNTGSQSCSMIGWPTIATPGLKTEIQYATFTGAGFMVPVTRVVVPPGSSAAAALDLFAAPGNSYGECDKPGSWAITPPGGGQPIQLAWLQFQGACLDGTVIVSPVYSGDVPEIGFGSLAPSQVPSLGPFSSPPNER